VCDKASAARQRTRAPNCWSLLLPIARAQLGQPAS